MRSRLLLLLFPVAAPLFSSGQYSAKESALIQKVAQARADSGKVTALGNLAEFYYLYRAEKKGDSILQLQIQQAELSSNKSLLLVALFGNAISHISEWSS